MKKLFIFSFIVPIAIGANSFFSTLSAQQTAPALKPRFADSSKKAIPPPSLSLGIGAGLNNYCGILGVGMNCRVADPLYIRAGAGVGSWGYKLTAGILFKSNFASGWAFGAAYCYATGLSNFSSSLQTVGPYGSTPTESVDFTLQAASTLNITASYDWYFKNKNFFFLEFGYAVPFQEQPYTINNGYVLTSTSQEAMKIVSPGGIVLAIGLMWGAN